MKYSAGLWSCAALLALASACDKGGDGSSRGKSCRTYCDRLELCDDETDVTGCEARCESEVFYSQAFLDARADCLAGKREGLSCNRIVDEVGSQGEQTCEGADCELQDCVNDLLAKVEPDEQLESFCEDMSNKLSACEDGLDEQSVRQGCSEVLLTLSTEYLDASDECVQMKCGEIGECLLQTADRYDTEISVYRAD